MRAAAAPRKGSSANSTSSALQLFDRLRRSREDRVVSQPVEAAEDRFLDALRQLGLPHLLAPPAQERSEGGQRLLAAALHHRPQRGGLDQAGPGQRRLGGGVVEQGGEPGRDALGKGGARGAGGLLHPARRLGEGGVVGDEEAVLLGGEVLVELEAGGGGALDDVGDGDGPVATLGDQVDGGGEDALALMMDDDLAAQLVAAGLDPLWTRRRRAIHSLRIVRGLEPLSFLHKSVYYFSRFTRPGHRETQKVKRVASRTTVKPSPGANAPSSRNPGV